MTFITKTEAVIEYYIFSMDKYIFEDFMYQSSLNHKCCINISQPTATFCLTNDAFETETLRK